MQFQNLNEEFLDPDFPIPALFIAGVYFRKFWVVFTLTLFTHLAIF
jgi:hypothetical protein